MFSKAGSVSVRYARTPGVPRTQRGVDGVGVVFDGWCERLRQALRSRPLRRDFKPAGAALVEDVVVSDAEKAHMRRQLGTGRQCTGSKFFRFAVEVLLPGEVTSKPGRIRSVPGGVGECPLTAQAVSGM